MESSGVDATDSTECIGNPNTLAVTKNNALYEKKHQNEQALLVTLKALLPATDVDVPPENEPLTEMQRDTTTKVVAGSSSHIDLT